MTRIDVIPLLCCLLLAGIAAAQEEAKSEKDEYLRALGELQTVLGKDSSRQEILDAYTPAKAAWDAYTAADADGAKAVEADFAAVRKDVADRTRRDGIPAMGWVTGFFGASLLWGGFMVCMTVAIRSGQSGTEAD